MNIIVLVSTPRQHAERISSEVLKRRLAACVNVIDGVHSKYRWKGRLEDSDESLLLFKTRNERFGELEKAITSAHPYEVPEIVAVPIIRGAHGYMKWVAEETTSKQTRRPRRSAKL